VQLIGSKIRDDLGKELRADVLANKYYGSKDAERYLKGAAIPTVKANSPMAMLWPSQGKPFTYVYLSVPDVKAILIQELFDVQWKIWYKQKWNY
jgi:hypothetical protein